MPTISFEVRQASHRTQASGLQGVGSVMLVFLTTCVSRHDVSQDGVAPTVASQGPTCYQGITTGRN